MLIVIQTLGYSPKLTTKLMRYVTAMFEATNEECEKEDK